MQLIRQVDSESDREKYGTIFFQIGEMAKNRSGLMALINRQDGPYYGRAMYTHNGVKLYLQIREIPQVLRLLLEEGFEVYSVYEVYEP